MRTGFVIAMLLSGCLLTAQETTPISLEKEAALGRQMAERFSSRTINDGIIQSYLHQMTQQVGPQIKNADFPFTVKAISDDQCSVTHEPVALPAGYIFVPAALFLAAQDEAEFAGMLAQAMERSVLRQGLHRVTNLQSLTSIPLIFMGTGCSDDKMMVPLAAQGKTATEADRLALEALVHAGFDPEGLSHYIERVQPDRPERAENIQYLLKLQPQANYIVDGSRFDAVRQRVRSLTEHVRKMPTLERQ